MPGRPFQSATTTGRPPLHHVDDLGLDAERLHAIAKPAGVAQAVLAALGQGADRGDPQLLEQVRQVGVSRPRRSGRAASFNGVGHSRPAPRALDLLGVVVRVRGVDLEPVFDRVRAALGVGSGRRQSSSVSRSRICALVSRAHRIASSDGSMGRSEVSLRANCASS